MKSIFTPIFLLFISFVAYAQPTANFTINAPDGCIDDLVIFTDTSTSDGVNAITNYDWDFDDGNSSTLMNPTHTYNLVGTFAITLTVTDAAGLTDMHTETYIVRAPQAAFVANPMIGCAVPHTVFFTDQSTFPDTWDWNFGDGNTSTLQNPVHNYTAFGDYTASLTVSDTIFGCTDMFTRLVKIVGVQTDFTSDTQFGCGPLTVNFTDTSIVQGNDAIATWSWDFGDGNTSTDQNPTHVYQTPGAYTVTLTTTSGIAMCSDTETKINYIQVIGPDPSFSTTSPTSGCVPLTVDFIDTSGFTGPIIAKLWDFGDGNTLNSFTDPSHTYTTAGIYDVSLTLTDIDGCSRTRTEIAYVVVTEPTANFTTTDPTTGCTPLTVNFTNTSSGLGLSYDWDFGDGNTSTDENPTHVYLMNGVFDVSLTVTDINSCADTFTEVAYIDTTDVVPPTALCVPNFTLALDATGVAMITESDIDAGSTDNCGFSSIFIDVSSFDCTNIGPNTVTLTIVDNAGNSDSCTTIVTIEDITPPSVACMDITVQLDGSGMATIVPSDVDAGSSDECGIDTYSLDMDTFDCSNVGANTVMLTVTDSSGNSMNCSAIVTVEDNELPNAVCQDITIQLDGAGMASIVPADIDGGSTDNCGIAFMDVDISTFNCSNVGPNDVALIIQDVNGNFNSCIAVVTVEDNMPPVAVCQDITIQLDGAGMASITPTDVEGGSTDNCGIAGFGIDITDFDCSDIGPNDVTLTVTDVNGNTSSCIAVVTVENTNGLQAVCQNITVQLDPSGMVSIVASDVDGGSVNTCAGANSLSIDMDTFDCTNVGPNNVILTVTDSVGNTDSCTAVVTVEDMVSPSASCNNFTIQLDAAGMASITVADVDGGSSDACGIASTSIDIDTFDCTNVGPNDVTLTVTDVNGNVSSCVAVVTVEDAEIPVAVCQDITVQLDATGMITVLPSEVDGGSTDNCGIDSSSLDIDTFDCSNIGPNDVILTVMDASGNTSSCMAVITVEDTVAPNAVCQDITIQLDSNGMATILPEDIDGGSTDACGISSLAIDMNTFDCSNIGPNNVTLSVQDVNGNISSCVAVVTVEEENAVPMAVCQNLTVPLQQDGTATITPQNVNAGSSGAGCFNGLSLDIDTFDCSDIGTPVMVTLTVTNGNGDTSSCTAIITVVDSIGPLVTCPADQAVDAVGQYILPDYFATGEATADDNCTDPVTNFTQDPAPGTALDFGVYTIELTATDDFGHVGSCEFTLTVDDALGIDATNQLQSLVLYPNPATEYLMISNPRGIKLEQVAIYDLMGRQILTESLDEMGNEQALDVSNLQSATYLVVISSEENQLIKQIVKE